MILLHVHNLTDITTYLQDCSDINVSHTIIRHNIPSVKLNKTNMLLQIQGRSVQQQIKAIFCPSVKFTSGEENEQQKDAEAYYHFQNLCLFFIFFPFFFFKFTSNRTNIHWHMQSEHFVVLFMTIQIQQNKDWISIVLLQTWKYSQIFTKKKNIYLQCPSL